MRYSIYDGLKRFAVVFAPTKQADAELIYLYDYLDYTSKGHTNGAVFLAIVNELGELPESEMAEVRLFDLLPDNLTYPFVTPLLFKRTLQKYYTEQRKMNCTLLKTLVQLILMSNLFICNLCHLRVASGCRKSPAKAGLFCINMV